MKKRKIYILITILTIILINTFSVFANENVLETINVEKATEKAISYSRNLKTLEENNYLAQQNYDDVKNDYLITDQSHEALNLVVRLKEAQNQLDNNKLNQDLEKESIKLNIINFLTELVSLEQELQLYEQSIEISRQELKISEVKKSLGLLSENEYNNLLSSYQKQLAERNNKKVIIDKAYRNLNKVLGENLDKRYKIILEKEYCTINLLNKNITLNEYILAGLGSSNRIRETKQNIEIKKYEIENYSSVLENESLKSKEISYSQSLRNLSEMEENLEEQITTLYNDIKKYEEDYNSKLEDIKTQEKNIKVLEIKYNLGLVTELEVRKAKFELNNLNLELERIIFNNNIAKMKLDNINLI